MTHPNHETALMLLRAAGFAEYDCRAIMAGSVNANLVAFVDGILAMAAAVDAREKRLRDRIEAALAILAFPPNTFEVMPSPCAPRKLLEQDWERFYDMIFKARAALEDKP